MSMRERERDGGEERHARLLICRTWGLKKKKKAERQETEIEGAACKKLPMQMLAI